MRMNDGYDDLYPRQRRAPSLDDLTSTLDRLEERMGIANNSRHSPLDEIRNRQSELSRSGRTTEQSRNALSSARVRELRDELTQLRAELAQERKRPAKPETKSVASDPSLRALRGDVESLKRDVTLLAKEDSIRDLAHRWEVLEREFSRLPETLGSRDDILDVARRIDALSGELQNLPQAMPIGAMQDQLHVLAEAVERMASNQTMMDPESVSMLHGRLDEISRAVAAIPQSMPRQDTQAFERLETRLQALAQIVEANGAQEFGHLDDHFNALARRMDDIQAVASTATDSAALADVNARLDRLTSDLHAFADRSANTANASDTQMLSDMGNRLEQVMRRIDELHNTSTTSTSDAALAEVNARLDRLTSDLHAFAERPVDAVDAADTQALDDMGMRLEQVLRRMDELQAAPASATSDGVMVELNARLDQLSTDLHAFASRPSETAGAPDHQLLQDMAQRLDEVAQRVEGHEHHADRAASQITSALDQRIQELATAIQHNSPAPAEAPIALDRIEARMEEISQMLGSGGNAQAPAFDASGLEAQIAHLSQELANVGTATPAAAMATDPQLLGRLDAIEQHLQQGHEGIITAAREAAENAASRLDVQQSHHDADAVRELADRLAELDALSRDTSDRNTQTFEAIHDTLLKVVDHLAGLEQSLEADGAPDQTASSFGRESAAKAGMVETEAQRDALDASQNMDTVHAPPLSMDEPVAESAGPGFDGISDADSLNRRRAQTMPPAKAAAAAALAALNNEDAINGTAGASNGTGKPAGTQHVVDPAISDVDDVMIAPGEGGPDLADIIQRVRAEGSEPRAQRPGHASADNGRSDFLAAARRAAQAAVADTSIADAKASTETGSGRLADLKALLSQRRKPLLMGAGAILLAILAIPAISGLFSGQSEPELAISTEPVAAIEEPVRVITTEQTDPFGDEGVTEGEMDALNPVADDGSSLEPLEAEGSQTSTPLPTPAPIELVVPADIGSVQLREAVAAADPKAIFLVGDVIAAKARSTGGAMADAMPWFMQSADLGFAPAQYQIANFYEKGTAGETDFQKAKVYYQLAAEQGNAGAMHNLGSLLASGNAGAPDLESATNWFHQAAELGVRDSQFNLGIIYGSPDNPDAPDLIVQDLVEAYKWFSLAAAQNDSLAAERRDEVAAFMTPEQIEMANGAVRLWQKRDMVTEVNVLDIPDAWKVSNEPVASTKSDQPDPDELKRAVRNVQAILNRAGYDAGPVDGVMGNKTRNAIVAFQQANGLPANGNIDTQLVQKLLEVNNTASGSNS